MSDDTEHYYAGPDDRVLVVVAPSSLTHETADDLRDTLARRFPQVEDAGAVVDLSGTGLISSLGIAALLQAAEFCSDRSGAFVLAGLSDQNTKFLKMLHLADRFRRFETTEDAVAALA